MSEAMSSARALWREGVPAAGTLAEVYLASRGLRLEPNAPLRFHPMAWRNPASGAAAPAMLALMTAPDADRGCGVHVTYLRPDGTGKATGDRPKVMLGNPGIIRLVADAEVTLGLGIAEGIEPGLAIMQRAGWRPVWAAASAGGIQRFPVLPGIEALTLFCDAGDGGRRPGLRAAEACARRWREAGREARIVVPPAGTDWHDALKEQAA